MLDLACILASGDGYGLTTDEVIWKVGPYGVLAFAVTVFATPIAGALAQRFGVMDMPDTFLKPHAKPTPYLGGLAIALGWIAAGLAGAFLLDAAHLRQLLVILPAGVMISILGLLDDLNELSPKLRLLLSGVVIAAVMLIGDVGLRIGAVVFATIGVAAPEWLCVSLSVLVGLLIVLGACNSTNLIDGLDGLAAGVTGIISLGFFLLAAKIAMDDYPRDDNQTRLLLALAMLGATVGFLPHNFNPARIFMGDAGSMLLGFNCGVMILLFSDVLSLRWMIGGLMIFALPVMDTALAIYRRWVSGKPIFQGDRSHFYDQLVDRGFSVRQAVIISYALTAVYAALGVAAIWLRLRYMLVLYPGVIIATVAWIHWAGMTRPEQRSPEPSPAG